MVPVMLCVKPFWEKRKLAQHHHAVVVEHKEFEVDAKGVYSQDDVVNHIHEVLEKEAGGAGNHNFGEIFIHQLIETIEFVLGTVSNTASYLRLWALSLAHGQLAAVFLEQLLKLAFARDDIGSAIPFHVILWPIFFTVTFGVLMLMDVLECFLHTLRLHWVEFQNKFYKGTGYKFVPYSFETILKQEMARSA
jgi:V-type H+-transporting ATPase subunit a